jgi:hypothetical protein
MNVSFPPPGINFEVKKVSVCISLFDVWYMWALLLTSPLDDHQGDHFALKPYGKAHLEGGEDSRFLRDIKLKDDE